MPHQVLGEIAGAALEAGADLATDEVSRRMGWKGCLTVSLLIVLGLGLLLWFVGAFSGQP
ncbi:hypothetical protein [Novosphingobium beihaiensis]|uniref:Uncharacterized protein n=1 Tax=Novosphingobium beihaiensis TaxID=2930389 RepID=A0ABT0BV34_9SPHN|nr:hypothetical protein [Novosphingobium beihaiensis]MCJ2188733.1 hypothetical protein [Novosphingobium beihaiensis]